MTGAAPVEGQRARAAAGVQAACCLAILALFVAGCGRSSGKPAPEEVTPAAPVATRLQSPTVKVDDPQGRWSFAARSKTMTAASEEGPFAMVEATGHYESAGQPSVRMQADRIEVDKGAQRLTLIGSVTISTPALRVEGERLSYDLSTGKVRAIEPTKWTFTGKGMASQAHSAGASGGRR